MALFFTLILSLDLFKERDPELRNIVKIIKLFERNNLRIVVIDLVLEFFKEISYNLREEVILKSIRNEINWIRKREDHVKNTELKEYLLKNSLKNTVIRVLKKN